MSPLSQIKKLALGDVEEVKRQANQAYLKQMTEKQIQHHEMSKRTLRKQDRSSHEIVDPIGYFENRYFPVAHEDLHLYEKSKRSLSKINEEKGQ